MNIYNRITQYVRRKYSQLLKRPSRDSAGTVNANDEIVVEVQVSTRVLMSEKIALAFGVRWVPINAETRLNAILEESRQAGYVYYVTNSYQETVGLAGTLSDGVKKAHSAALILSQQFAQGGTELFVFRQGEHYGLVGLVDYSPIPGFDALGTEAEIRHLSEEFVTLNGTRLVRFYGNTHWFDDEERLDLSHLAEKASKQISALRLIPNLKFLFILGFSAMVVIAGMYAAYDYYRSILDRQQQIEQTTLNDPNRLYEINLTEALKKTGPPGIENVQLWQKFFSDLPLAVNGWIVKTVICQSRTCEAQWTRVSGNFKDFETALSEDSHGKTQFKLEKELMRTEVKTRHDLNYLINSASEPESFIHRKHLVSQSEAQKIWGSHLQDIALLSGSHVALNSTELFGGRGIETETVESLNKPIVKGNWSIDHDIWSLSDLIVPDFVVPEQLTLHVDLKTDVRYRLEGAYYAKGK